ncbi:MULTISPECIES: ABC transporter ATP-binding protein [unclassified Kosmotoga]|uniref:ABC transporter ATP-binding protein n=1 Tax=unclassified Kosmotoga TaxID=2631489 RepID=UPI0007C50877|nr:MULTISPECIES: ABC transporter ATP-binding protein [unclassified Kosmotoga]MDI3523681.1 Fe-S cluster assembly ATP-binding protein [Kosmotoga sp.]MDK2954387.1 Fe-S cluster assembly ATP-binding protein [Kosmotoga sp.]OAA23022.1 ABC transporter ATP-binding protein [Kosmotoga sp. DU53]
MLELKNVFLERENRVIIKNMSVAFEDNKVYSILGNNGVGKSTLAYIIMGLENYRDHKGDIIFNSKKINDLSVSERSKLGITLVWQEPVRFEGITTREYLTLGGKLKLSNKELLKILNLVGLSEAYLDRVVDSSLSGGERKRIELASALILKPKLVILDEPDSGIDIMSTDMIEAVLNHFKSNGATVLVITHREEIARMTDEAYLMCGGRMLASGTPDEIIAFYKRLCDKCSHTNQPVEEEKRGVGR